METVWTILNSPAVIAAIAAILLWALNRLYMAKPAWQQYEGTIISAIKWAEKHISDDTPNKSLRRLDEALDYVLQVYEQMHGQASAKVKAELREGIQITHADLESQGQLG